jgi:adenylate cyclase
MQASHGDSAPRSTSERFFEFGSFRLYPYKRLLLQGDQPVAVTPKVLDTLRVLVTNNGRVVSKEELMSEVWAETIVEEGGLTRNISVLRKVLGKDPQGHGFIATLPGKGYQFVAEVRDFATIPPGWTRHQIVGRDRELASLHAAFEAVSAGSGLLLCLGGETGIGKTALVEDFLRGLGESGVPCTIARARCSERLTGTGAALPWLEALDGLCRTETATIRSARLDGRAVARTIKNHAPSWYAQLSSLTVSDAAQTLASEIQTASQERMKLELNSLLEHLTRNQPMIIFLDDLHWADASTSELLSFLVGKFASLRVLVITTYRPTDMRLAQHPLLQSKDRWRAHGLCREETVDFLSCQAVEDYLNAEFPHHLFPTRLAALIHQRTAGNALFMTELVRDLRTKGLLSHQGKRWVLVTSLADVEERMPESIRGMIESKISQLNESELRLLEAASAQGYDFDSAVVARALDVAPALVEEEFAHLERIKNFISFVEEKQLPDSKITLHYRFVHVLYQEAIYTRIQPTRLIELSARIAGSMLSHWADRSSEVASELATLFESARSWQRAADFFRLSARRASRFSAPGDAVNMARRGLSALSKLKEKPKSEDLEFELKVILGISLLLAGNWESEEAEQNLEDAYTLGKLTKDDKNMTAAEWGRLVTHSVHGRFQEALKLGEQMVARATESGDPGHQVIAHSALGTVLGQSGALTSGADNLSFALSRHDPVHMAAYPALSGVDFAVRCHCYLARTLWLLGLPDQARRQIEHAVDANRHAPGNLMLLGRLSACTVYQFLRESEPCAEHAESVIRISGGADRALHTDSVGWAGVALGWALVQQGKVAEGLPMMREALEIYRRKGRGWIAQSVMFAEVLCGVGELNEALQVLDQTEALVDETGEGFFNAEIHRIRGDALRKRLDLNDHGSSSREDALAEIEACYERAIAISRTQEARSLELRAVMSLAHLLDQCGRRDEARQRLSEIYNWFTEGFATRDLCDARTLLDALSSDRISAKS